MKAHLQTAGAFHLLSGTAWLRATGSAANAIRLNRDACDKSFGRFKRQAFPVDCCFVLTSGGTSYTQADPAMADQHIAQGEEHIVQQEELLTSLELTGLPTAEAQRLLALFNETQAEHRRHRDAIASALG